MEPPAHPELVELEARFKGLLSDVEQRWQQVFERHRIDAPQQVVADLHKQVFAAVDARPPAPQLYKIEPSFLERFDLLEGRVEKWLHSDFGQWCADTIAGIETRALAAVKDELEAIRANVLAAVVNELDRFAIEFRKTHTTQFSAPLELSQQQPGLELRLGLANEGTLQLAPAPELEPVDHSELVAMRLAGQPQAAPELEQTLAPELEQTPAPELEQTPAPELEHEHEPVDHSDLVAMRLSGQRVGAGPDSLIEPESESHDDVPEHEVQPNSD